MLLTEQDRDRTKVEPKYTWNLAEIFPDFAAWRAAKAAIQAELRSALRLVTEHGWRSVDISYKAVEEVAVELIHSLS